MLESKDIENALAAFKKELNEFLPDVDAVELAREFSQKLLVGRGAELLLKYFGHYTEQELIVLIKETYEAKKTKAKGRVSNEKRPISSEGSSDLSKRIPPQPSGQPSAT